MFELLFGYRHCFGKTLYSAGTVASEDEARHWVEAQAEQGSPPFFPREEPVATCPVTSCPIRRQKPWFAYRLC